MSICYKEKYLKYKIKYINLSKYKEQIGAGFNPNGPQVFRRHRVNENNDHSISIADELNESDNCAICLELLNINPNPNPTPEELLSPPVLSKIFPCNHIYHQRCLTQILQRDRKCPLCRRDINNIYTLNRNTMTWDVPIVQTTQITPPARYAPPSIYNEILEPLNQIGPMNPNLFD